MFRITPIFSHQAARVAGEHQERRVSAGPQPVTIVLGGETLVITLSAALTPLVIKPARMSARAGRLKR